MFHNLGENQIKEIIDGSYNLTASANYNKEELATAIDKSFVMKFADEFMDAYRQGKNIK